MGRKDKEITRLRRELASARRENARLERELSELRGRLQLPPPKGRPPFALRTKATLASKEQRLLEDANRRARHYRKCSFFRYLWEAVMDSTLVGVLRKLWRYIRRIRVIQVLLTLLPVLGAMTVVAVLSAGVLPFLLSGTVSLSILALLRSRRMNHRLSQALKGQRIRILIPTKGAALDKNSFFIRSAHSMAQERDITVLVVTPYPLSRRGLGGKGFFLTARREGPRVYLIRKHYFFLLRRRVLDTMDSPMTIVY